MHGHICTLLVQELWGKHSRLKSSRRLKMLHPFTHWPAENLALQDKDNMQGNKVPAGHSNLVRAACLGPSGCCCRPNSVPVLLYRKEVCTSHELSWTCHPHAGKNKVSEHPCCPQHCCWWRVQWKCLQKYMIQIRSVGGMEKS